MLDAELATAMLEAPTALFAYGQGASRAMEGERAEAKTPVAQPATFAPDGLKRDDNAAGDEAAWGGQPLRRVKAADEEYGFKAEQGAASERGGQQPSGLVQDGEEARGEAAQDADKQGGEQRRIEPAESPEKLHGNPKNGKSNERTCLIESHGCSPPAL